jgi:hypothetical protein
MTETASWRRGVMFAVERLDIIVGKKITKTKALVALEQIRDALNELTEFQRNHDPKDYKGAFRLCEDHNHKARESARTE